MHYALYRKYRPLTFSDVVGQSHITKTLSNQISHDLLSHAYLFCGTRGTGKTTCAKILSRAVNCIAPIDGEPCNKCEICKGILNGSIFDVIEIDAASNNGVENIRQIRDEIIYTPVKAKYKVYIIDEVHMLSPGAFNALLKTLEEPPPHVIFILATTEAHKIPATILSRCQRFDFKRLSIQDISKQIRKILDLEHINIDNKTIQLVASLADGSVRDALSILEKVSDSNSYEEAERLLGVIGKGKLYKLAECMAREDTPAVYEFIDELYYSSKDLNLMLNELTEVFRDILAIKSQIPTALISDKNDEDIQHLKKISEMYTYEHIIYAMDILFKANQSFSKSSDKRAAAELCLIKIAKPIFSNNTEALLTRIEKLETQVRAQKEIHSENREIKNDITEEEPPGQEKPKSNTYTLPNLAGSTKKDEAEGKQQAHQKNQIMTENFSDNNKTTNTVQHTTNETAGSDSDLWQEFMSLKDIADTVREKDRSLGVLLANYCRAVYNKKQIVILCTNDRDLSELRNNQNICKISDALIKNRKSGYEVKIAKGTINEYVKENFTYNNIENNSYFEFN